MPSENSNQEETVTYPLKMLTPNNLQFLLNYIARDLGFVDGGKYKTTINGVWIHKNLDFKTNGYYTKTCGNFPFYNYNYSTNNISNVDTNFKSYISLSNYHVIKTYKNKIHLFGVDKYTTDYVLKYVHLSGIPGNWRIDSSFPYENSRYYKLTEYNNKLHFIYNKRHLTWDGKKWEKLPNLSKSINDYSNVITYNNKIYLFAGSTKNVYTYNGNVWTQENDSTLNVNFLQPRTIVFNNKIYMFPTYDNKYLYSFDGINWTQEDSSDTLNNLSKYSPLFIYNNSICFIYNKNIYSWDGIEWTINTVLPELPYNVYNGYCYYCYPIVFNNNIYIFGNISIPSNDENYKYGGIHYLKYDSNNNSWITSLEDPDVYIQKQKYELLRKEN